MIRPFLYLVGFHVLCVPADRGADLVNICAQAGVVYHPLGTRRMENGEAELLIRVSPYASLRLRTLCRTAKIDVRLVSRHGLGTLLCRILRRPGIVAGLCACILMTALGSRVIWDVRIEGNDTVSDEVITDLLRECGVGVGSDKTKIDVDAVKNRFLIKSDEISWITVNIIGTVAEVEVRETKTQEQAPDYVASNLVASRNGTVVEFEEVRGNIAVELGEDVSEGELLVGGVYGSETSALRFTRAEGRVMALCRRDYSVKVALQFDKKVYTGRKKIKKSLIFFEKEVKLFRNSGNLYTSCDIINKVEYLNFFGLGKLPFGVRSVEYVEYQTETAQRSEEQASEQANFQLWQMFFADAPTAQTVGKKLLGRLEDGYYILEAEIECIENIAVEKEIEIDIMGTQK